MSREPVAVRAYGAMTRLYPRRFRAEYGVDMVSMFRDQSRDESTWRVALRAAVDLAITIPTQHLEKRMRKAPSPVVPLIYLAVALAGLLLAVTGGTNTTIAIVGLLVAAIAGTLGVVALRRSAPVNETPMTGHWWKFVVVGPCLIAAAIIGANMGIEAWELMMLTGFTAIASTVLGVMLGIAHLHARRARGIAT